MKEMSFCSAPALDSKGNPQHSKSQIPLRWVEPDSLSQDERKARNEARKLKKSLKHSK